MIKLYQFHPCWGINSRSPLRWLGHFIVAMSLFLGITALWATSPPLFEKKQITQCLVSTKEGDCQPNTVHTSVQIQKVDPTATWPLLNFYSGFGLGYGDTDWSELVGQDKGALLTTPNSAQSGGVSEEVFFGYYLLTNLALEARYVHYAPATMTFLPFAANVYNMSSLTTNTDDYALVGKFFVPVALHDRLSVFASFGANYTERKDVLANLSIYGVTFGAGLQWHFAPRFMTAFEFQYSTGFGSSVKFPVYTYIPFLYNADLRIAYLFNL